MSPSPLQALTSIHGMEQSPLQPQRLRQLGSDYVQGYHLQKPMSMAALNVYLSGSDIAQAV